jgi:putative acyl-CoA dehydrogenase
MTSLGATVTHEIQNQVPPRLGFNAFVEDELLRAAAARGGADWIVERAAELGAYVGSEEAQTLAALANRHLPELHTHDARGRRLDRVEYHPAYHALLDAACRRGLHSLPWSEARAGAHVARATLFYLWNELENGTACPLTMTFAGVKLMRYAPELALEWEPKLLAADYDPRPLPVDRKRAAMVGMALTEKQGGSDLRAVSTTATAAGGGRLVLRGHKWFCSAPMSDGFFTLARLDDAATCCFVPRSLPDGSRNRFLIQRLKDKCGNRANASAEIEYDGTIAYPVGVPGRGIATILEMAHLTRLDILAGTAGLMRAAFQHALHHARHRRAFGALLVDQPLMRSVLADLALENEAATLLAFRAAEAFDRAPVDDTEAALARILTPVAKYWLTRRAPPFVAEAMECLGGNGYVEESPHARLHRAAPLNGIWEGSGNVICLDVLRALARSPRARDALFDEVAPVAQEHGPVRHLVRRLGQALRDPATLERRGRWLVESLALVVQASLMVQHAHPAAADAFLATRLGDAGGRAFGAIPADVDADLIVARAAPG